MKTKLKRLSKRTVSVILCLVMIVSMTVVGMISANAGICQGGYVYFIVPSSDWYSNSKKVYLITQQSNDYFASQQMTQIRDNLFYVESDSNRSGWSEDSFFFISHSSWDANGTYSLAEFQADAAHCSGEKIGYDLTDDKYILVRPTDWSSTSTGYAISADKYDGFSSLGKQQTVDVYTDGTKSNTGGNVNITAYFPKTAKTTLEQSTENGSSSTVTYNSATAGTNVTVTAVPDTANNYEFDGWYTAATGGSKISDLLTYTYMCKGTGYDGNSGTLYARFKTGIQYDITKGSNNDSYGTVTSSPNTTVAQGGSVTFTATPTSGYYLEGWYSDSTCETRYSGTSANPSLTLTVSNVQNDITVYGKFVEKATKTISVDVDENAKVTVSGSSVAGQNQTFTSDGTFTAHVDDVISFSAAGKTNDYTYDALEYTTDGSTYTSGTSFTVALGTYGIRATSRVKSGYYFYVSAGTGATATVAISSGTFGEPSGESSYVVTGSARQKFYVDDDAKNVTVTSGVTDSSTYENPAITLVATDIEHGSSVASPATVTKDNNGATYYVTASTKGGSDSGYYFWYATGTNQDNLSSQGKMKYINGSSGAVYFDIDVPAGNVVCSFRQDSSTWKSTFNTSAMTDPDSLTSSIERKENSQNYYNLLNFKSAGKVRFVYESTSSAYVTTASASGDITAFDTYYLGGRFRISDGDSGQTVYSGTTEGDWKTYSIKMPFTATANANEYKLETNQTIAQLSAQLDSKSPYFVVHDKKDVYHTSGSSLGLTFQDQKGSANALTLQTSGGLTYENELMFSDAENNSDGKVVIYFNSNTMKIWYEVEDETAAMAESVDLTAEYNNSTVAETTVGNEITLKATLTNPHANASGDKTYTFINTITGATIGTVTTSANTASTTFTENTVRTDTFKVVVSSEGMDNTKGKKLRDVVDTCNVKFKSKAIYRTGDTSLNGAAANLFDTTNWVGTALTDETDNSFQMTLGAGTTYEFALATTKSTSNSNYSQLDGEIPEDFYIDEKLTKYCDVEYYTLTVTYQNGDDTEQYVVRTYKVTPRTNSANPTIHINTTPIAIKQANGETKYYPGYIWADATYTATKTNTKAETETVTYYFAEAVGDEDQSKTGDGMSIAYWNNSLNNIRTTSGSWADNIKDLPAAQFTDVTTAVNVDGKDASGNATTGVSATNTIFVDMTKLYESKAGNESGKTYKQFKIYSVDLPIWATSFAFMKSATSGDANNVIKTTSWKEGTAYEYSSLLLNPNRVYLLYSNTPSGTTYWYSKGVVLDKGLWDSTVKNNVDLRTFKSNVINYNSDNSKLNTALSTRFYNSFANNKGLYFGLFDYDQNSSVNPSLNQWKLVNNLAMRGQRASDYHASVQNLVAEKLDTDNLNSNGFPILQAYTDTAAHNKVNMPLFDYSALATDKSSYTDTVIDKQYLGVDFPMYESKINGITTYSYDSSTDPNRAIDSTTNNFVIDSTWRLADVFLGYLPFAKTNDGEKFGNGTELDVEFFMTNTGHLRGTGGTTQDIAFNFSGDDDVWVFVDGVLVLDLGGDHMASSGTINFTDMKVYYKTAAMDSVTAAGQGTGNAAITATWPHETNYVNTIDMQALLEANGVNFNNKDGNTKHTFQMFYMERGGVDSNMSVSFNLPQASGLNIKNEITANNVNAGLKEAALYAAQSDYFTYNVSAALDDGSLYSNVTSAYSGASKNTAATSAVTAEAGPKYPMNTDTNRVYSETWATGGNPSPRTTTYPLSRANQNSSNGAQYSESTTMTTLNNVTYSLSDAYLQPLSAQSTELDVSGKTDASGNLHLLSQQTATFDDKVTPHSFVKIYQDTELGKAKVTDMDTPVGYENVSHNEVSNYYLTSYSIYDDHSATYIMPKTEGVVNSHTNKIYADDASTNTNMFYFSDYAKTASSAAMTVTYYNDIAVGDIRITKDYNYSSAGTTFYFDLKFANIFGSDDSEFESFVDYNLLTYDVYDSNGAVVSRGVPYGVAGIVLKGGQYAVISGVPVETRYQVTERTKSGTSLEDINKYVKGPDGNNLASPIPTSHGYAEHFDSTAIKQNNISSTSTDYVLKDGDKYYVNMIPIVEESYVNGSGYKTTSYVTFTNIKTSVKITFKYYDRSVQNGVPANINEANTTYTVYNSLPDTIEGETNVEVVKQKIKEMIENSAVEFQTQALTQNVVDTYIMWSSQSDAEEGIGEQTNIKTLEQYKKESDFATSKAYHTNSKSQLLKSDQTELNKWVSYKTGNVFRTESYFETGEKALEITDISVWLFNTPRTYTVNIYGAKSISELSAESTVSLNGNDTNIRVASSSLSESKITKNDVYYNQRLGQALNVDGIDTTTYISQYDRNSFRTDIEPIDYITGNTLTDNGKSYRFAYWAYDPAGKVVASTNAYFYYRITKNTDLYAVYSETQLKEREDVGLSIFNNVNDTYVDSNGKSRTRINVMVNPYACADSDDQIKQTAMVYVNLSDVVSTWNDTDILALFNTYRNQLNDILTSHPASTVTSKNDIFTFSPAMTLNGASVETLTLTTKGFIRNANGNDVPAAITTTAPTTKNRVQYSMNISTASLKKETKLMFVGAMYYNTNYENNVDHWIISDNCLIYENGVCKELDFDPYIKP